MVVLVTGGLGFIGSHTVVELIQSNYEVVIADNLCNSKLAVLNAIETLSGYRPKFYQLDVTDEDAMEQIFRLDNVGGVIHFAGLKAVGESVSKPLEYYFNNLVGTMVLSKLCVNHGVGKFVFSSSATVYGDQPSPLIEEMHLEKAANPYGHTKEMGERILTDAANAYKGLAVSLLRYFNPIGAHKSGLLGEDPNGIPNNLMPFITKVAKGDIQKLQVFGNDYDTVDGTGVRDYIHVVDLAKGHVKALDAMAPGVSIYNLGTGKGTSVLELIHAFEEANKIKVPYEIVSRRPGDLAVCYADSGKVERELGWRAVLTIEDMVRDAWKFACSHRL